ncbi:hypothetical protein [Bacillus pumilus]|uniref:Uncharacterized protein n=1 Tax=Bacillus pumilus TaxID=1408 RepID=A0AAD2PS81_BACPU|nr:hypothetical protein [Bacillus pumilus]AVM25565.1 hypothetical protein C5695_17640 [Bacillus pumilus]TYS43558.1 hypothetical protein FZC68_05650 [Bacillus pumilus]
MNLATILSLVAIAVSLFTLGIHLLKYLHTVPKVKIDVLNSYLFRAENQDRYASPYRLIIELNLVNKSEQPISIYEYEFVSKDIGQTTFMKGHHRPADHYTIGKNMSVNVSDTKLLKPPVNLSPYSSEYGVIAFTTIKELNTDSSEIDGWLIVKTSRKSYSIKMKAARSDL